jgi:CRP-like cAMP-binding protein
VPADSTVFFQGEMHTTFIIREGLVRTFYVAPSGKEITLAYWSAGDLIGGPYLFDDRRTNIWSARAVAQSVVLAIEGAELEKLARQLPALALFLIDSLSFKLHWASLLLQLLGTEFVHCRVATLLMRLAELYGEPHEQAIVIPYTFTQSDLAAMVGATRQGVSTSLGRLQREGIVQLHKRRLHILNPKELSAQTISS